MLLDYKQIDNEISLSWWDSEGSVQTLSLLVDDKDMFNWVTCSDKDPNRSEKYRNWDGKAVKPGKGVRVEKGKKLYPRLSDFRIAEIIDDIRLVNEDLYNEIFSYSLPRMAFIDIETDIADEFPDPSQAKQPITCIGVATQKHEVIVLGTKSLSTVDILGIQEDIDNHCKVFDSSFKFIYKGFDSECAMLVSFLKLVRKIPMMSGWNYVWFDWFYIQNRCKLLNIDLRSASPRGELSDYARDNGNVCTIPLHIGIVDYMNAYDKWSTNAKENLKLDQAGYDVLGVRKVHYSGSLKDLYRNDYRRYIFYNAIDCILVEKLHEKLGVSTIGCTIAYLAKMRSTKMFSPIALTESVLARGFYERGLVLADKIKKKDEDDGKYEGAYVKAPVVGYHRCCICNDFASLYPNIIRTLNLSPETYVAKIGEDDDELRKEWLSKGYIVSRSGCVFKQDPGVFSTLVGKIYNKRKQDKNTSYDASDKVFLLEEILNDVTKTQEDRNAAYESVMGEKPDGDVSKETISALIKRFVDERELYHNFEQGEKRMINSFYGGFGNSHMYFYNRDLAECITKQGKDAILFAERNINEYFLKQWHNDTETHHRLGVKVHGSVTNCVSVYIDTDSVYSQLDEVIRTTDWCLDGTNWLMTEASEGKKKKKKMHWFCGNRSEEEARAYFDGEGYKGYTLTRVKGEAKDFALAIDDVFLAGFFRNLFDGYAKEINATNYLVFELERYSDAGIWLAKKKYMQHVRWTDDMRKDEIMPAYSKIKATGIEMVQPSAPAFARKKLKEGVKWIFSHENFEMSEFMEWIKKARNEFMLADLEDICWNKKSNGYATYVVNDQDGIEVRLKTPPTVKAMALYNYLLNNRPKLKGKYNTMKGGEKCKFYYCTPVMGKWDMFAFEPGLYPEFAPAPDRAMMFEKTVIDPLNRILEVLPNARAITDEMIRLDSLF